MLSNGVAFGAIQCVQKGLAALAKIAEDDFEGSVEKVALGHEGKHAGGGLETGLVLALLGVAEPQNAGSQVDADVLERSDKVHVALLVGQLFVALADAHVLGGEGQNAIVGRELAVQHVADTLLAVSRLDKGRGRCLSVDDTGKPWTPVTLLGLARKLLLGDAGDILLL